MNALFSGALFADYFQIYMADALSEPLLPEVWTDVDVERRLLAADGVVVMSTARNMSVPVAVHALGKAPEDLIAEADHVVIAPLTSTGRLGLAGCTDYWPDAQRFDVPPGPLTLLFRSYGLATLSEDGLDGRDRYEIVLWPGAHETVRILRAFEADPQ
jgi:hypothetical protein